MSIFSKEMTQIRHHRSDEGEGPFVSFADLMFGIIFLFLIIIAALLILPKHMVDEPTLSSNNFSQALANSKNQVHSLEQQTLDLKAQLAKIRQSSTVPPPSPPAVSAGNRELISDDQETIAQLSLELAEMKVQKAAIQSKLVSLEKSNERSLSDMVTINDIRISLQSQLNAAEAEETRLRAQLSQSQGTASSSTVSQIETDYATKIFSYNQYGCEVPNCSELRYMGTYTILRTGINSFTTLTVSIPPYISNPSSSNPLSRTDLDSAQCSETLSREKLSFDCSSSFSGHKVASFNRTSADVYEGVGTHTLNGLASTFHLRWQIIEFDDPSFQ